MYTRRNVAMLLVTAASVMMSGCGGPARKPASTTFNPDTEFPDNPVGTNEVQRPQPIVLKPHDKGVIDATGYGRATDPCMLNMDDIGLPMMEYYIAAGHLPKTLHDLAAFSSDPLDFTCPVTHETYVYRPVVLTRGSNQAQLILYDATATEDKGMRWGLLALPPRENRPLSISPKLLTKEQFAEYMRQGTLLTSAGGSAGTQPGQAK